MDFASFSGNLETTPPMRPEKVSLKALLLLFHHHDLSTCFTPVPRIDSKLKVVEILIDNFPHPVIYDLASEQILENKNRGIEDILEQVRDFDVFRRFKKKYPNNEEKVGSRS